jgi:pimeloyl-ACP methyl ester carboxylesterase
MKKYIGSRDYKAASPMMKNILVQTVNEDLSDYARKIDVPTLLIWGDLDTEVSIEEAKETEKLIKDAALIVLPNSTHYAYLENLNQVTNIIKEFV